MDINRPVYLVLIAGVIISSVLFGLAFALNLIMPSQRDLIYILSFFGAGVLILTPYFRILVSLIVFIANKEYKYAFLSFLVLLVMIISLIVGLFFHIAPKG
ncbi:MAG: DUF1634 domain-containing protein [Nitrososphaeria archaeon]|nr:DUF1634 domain-containing protein [Nitrososphaeria archaeon]